MNRYDVLLSDTENGNIKAAAPECEVQGKTDDEVLVKIKEALTTMLRQGRWATVEISTEPVGEQQEIFPFTHEEFEEITAQGVDHPHYWEALEAVVERFSSGLDENGYSLEKMLATLPEAGEQAFRRRYGDALTEKYKEFLTQNRSKYE